MSRGRFHVPGALNIKFGKLFGMFGVFQFPSYLIFSVDFGVRVPIAPAFLGELFPELAAVCEKRGIRLITLFHFFFPPAARSCSRWPEVRSIALHTHTQNKREEKEGWSLCTSRYQFRVQATGNARRDGRRRLQTFRTLCPSASVFKVALVYGICVVVWNNKLGK